MENNKKSGSGIFWFIIPVVMIIASFLYDNAIMITTEKKYRYDSENIIKEVLTNSYSESDITNMVERLYTDKGYEITNLDARYEDGVLSVYNVHVYPSFFTRLFGVKSYRTEVDIKGYLKDGELVIE